MKSTAEAVLHNGPYDENAVIAAGARILASLGGTATCAFAFISPDYLPHLEDFTELLRLHGHIPEVIGSTGQGLVGGETEQENGSGFSVLALRLEGAGASIVSFSRDDLNDSDAAFWRKKAGKIQPKLWIPMLNPVDMDVEDWMEQWNQAFPGVPCVGGLSSGGPDVDSFAIFHNDRLVDSGVAIALHGDIEFDILVSQGCRPIGEPLPVTRAEANVIYLLGARPAYQELEAAYQTLDESEKAQARGNLFAGLAGNEYVDEFKPGDFLVRNIIGADPESGAVVINGLPRMGQTVQYQFRDKATADADFQKTLKAGGRSPGHRFASLLFTCNGRGKRFFGAPNHDAALLSQVLGPLPTAGFFCNGEIGPVSGINCIHGYTASAVVLRQR